MCNQLIISNMLIKVMVNKLSTPGSIISELQFDIIHHMRSNRFSIL
jgi:hypothetical protein